MIVDNNVYITHVARIYKVTPEETPILRLILDKYLSKSSCKSFYTI